MSEAFRTRQEPLFIESLEEALEATALACGGKKAFACAINPDLADDPEAAHRWFLDALNSTRRTAIHAAHLRRACNVARQKGVHILKHWFDDSTGYERTREAPAKSEHEVLADDCMRLAIELQRKAALLSKLEKEATQLKAVNV